METTEVTFIIAQALGGLSFFLNAVGSSKMTTKKVYAYNTICNILAVAQYALLGAWAGALCCLIAIGRNMIFPRFKKKIPLYVLLIYIALVIALNFGLIHNFLDVLPVFNIIIYAIALWTKNIMTIKALGLITCFTGIVYDFFSRAYAAIFNEVIIGVIKTRCIFILKKKRLKKRA